MNSILHFSGSPVLSSFRQERLLQRFADLGLPVAGITAHYEHYVWVSTPLDDADQEKLVQLLRYGEPTRTEETIKSALVLRVFPRFGTVSPWASKATDIAHNCGLDAVRRIERGIHYRVTPARGLLGAKTFSPEQLDAIAGCLHDRMTDTVVDASFDGALLFASLPGKPIQTIDVITQGQAALEIANRELGLADRKSVV